MKFLPLFTTMMLAPLAAFQAADAAKSMQKPNIIAATCILWLPATPVEKRVEVFQWLAWRTAHHRQLS